VGDSDRIGQYEIVREIGRGGMGVVLLARDAKLDREVAIKTLPAELASDSKRLERLKAEARVVAQLNHPHIAQIHHLFEDGGRLYLVLEYVAGLGLWERLRADGGLGIEESIRLMGQVAQALGAAHSRGVIHRDLKPENVRLTEEGAAKVLDFGIAVAVSMDADGGVDPDDETRAMTAEPGMITGTPAYTAPEQARGEPVDARADIFSFGCLLYECLSGTKAFDVSGRAGAVWPTLYATPDLSFLPTTAPGPVRELVRRCLERELDARPASAAELIEVLQGGAGPSIAAPRREAPKVGNLGVPRDRFIGRSRETAQIASLLRGSPLVTLTGSGGCGKTRLAIEVGLRVGKRFCGGVWIAELGDVADGGLVAPAVAMALGVKEEPPVPLETTLSGRLAGKPTLLILDNCEHVLEGVGDLTRSLLDECPELRVIATSREALGVEGEYAWRVPSLATMRSGDDTPTPTPASLASTSAVGLRIPRSRRERVDPAEASACEAVALFVDRASVVKPGFELTEENATSVVRICERLDGIPLAIELAAARVKMLNAVEIERRLDDRFRLLRASRSKSRRHQTLQAAMDWSYQLLDEEEQHALRQLTVLAGDWSLEAATFVVGGEERDEFDVLDLLTRLLDKSLISSADTGAETRYRLLETVRAYAREKLREAGEEGGARDRHLDFFGRFAEEASGELRGAEEGQWLERLDAELENLLEAIRWGGEASAPASLPTCASAPAPGSEGAGSRADQSLRIAGALSTFWGARGHYRAARDAIGRVLDSGREADPSARAQALHTAGSLAWRQGDLNAAQPLLEEALELRRAAGDRIGEGGTLGNLGVLARRLGDLERAQSLMEEALAIFREGADPLRIAIALGNLGTIASDRGELERASELWSEALALHRAEGQRAFEPNLLASLGSGYRRLGRPGEARRALAEALALIAELGDRQVAPEAIDQVGILASVEGDDETAALLFGAASALSEEIGQAPDPQTKLEVVKHEASGREAMGAGWLEAHERGRQLPFEAAVRETIEWLRSANEG